MWMCIDCIPNLPHWIIGRRLVALDRTVVHHTSRMMSWEHSAVMIPVNRVAYYVIDGDWMDPSRAQRRNKQNVELTGHVEVYGPERDSLWLHYRRQRLVLLLDSITTVHTVYPKFRNSHCELILFCFAIKHKQGVSVTLRKRGPTLY
jgi:hypothetical protein